MGTFCIIAFVALVLLGIFGYIALLLLSRAAAKRERETIEQGRPVVGTLVMANNELFKPEGIDSAPGVIILSYERPTPELLAQMRAVGSQCFEMYKAANVAQYPPALRAVAEAIKKDRYQEDRRMLLPSELTGSLKLYMADLWIYRDRLTPWFQSDRVLVCLATGDHEGALAHMPAGDPRAQAILPQAPAAVLGGASPFGQPVPAAPAPFAPATEAFAPQPAIPMAVPAYPPAPYGAPGHPYAQPAPYPQYSHPANAPSEFTARLKWLLGMGVAILILLGVASFAVVVKGLWNGNSRPVAQTPNTSNRTVAPRSDLEEKRQQALRRKEQRDKQQADWQQRQDLAERQRADLEAKSAEERRRRDEQQRLDREKEEQQRKDDRERERAQEEARRREDMLQKEMKKLQAERTPKPSIIQGTAIDALDTSTPVTIPISNRNSISVAHPGSLFIQMKSEIWDASRGERLAIPESEKATFASNFVSADGRWVARTAGSGGQNTTITVYSLETQEKTFETTVDEFEPNVTLQLVRNRFLVISGTRLNESTVFDITNGEKKYAIKKDERITIAVPWFSPDGTRYVQPSMEGVAIYATRGGAVVADLEMPDMPQMGPPGAAPNEPEAIRSQRLKIQRMVVLGSQRDYRFSPDGKEVAAVFQQRFPQLVCWNDAGKVVFNVELPELKDVSALDRSPIWLPDGRGWIVRGAIVERKSKRIVLALHTPPGFVPVVFPYDNDHLLASTLNEEKTLRKFVIPWDRIQTALDTENGEQLPFLIR